jgi:D-alanyl-D-alanine carboxypeptidase
VLSDLTVNAIVSRRVPTIQSESSAISQLVLKHASQRTHTASMPPSSPTSRRIRRTTRRSTPRSISCAASRRTRPAWIFRRYPVLNAGNCNGSDCWVRACAWQPCEPVHFCARRTCGKLAARGVVRVQSGASRFPPRSSRPKKARFCTIKNGTPKSGLGDRRPGRHFHRNRLPFDIVQIFEKHGFIWGGKWGHFDTMHFEYRPELL